MRTTLLFLPLLAVACAAKPVPSESPSPLEPMAVTDVSQPQMDAAPAAGPEDPYPNEDPSASMEHEEYNGEFDGDIDEDMDDDSVIEDEGDFE